MRNVRVPELSGEVRRLSSGLAGVRPASELGSSVKHSEQLGDRLLPVAGELAGLLPLRGLRRGSTVSVQGSTSLLLAMLAAATSSGAWAAVVGMPDLGVLAAAELGVAVRRLAMVPYPGGQAAGVLAALLDGVDLVVVTASCVTGGAGAVGDPRADRLARRLSARARHRGAVLLAFGSWPGAEVQLSARTRRWSGLGAGDGHLTEREVWLDAAGRGAAARPVRSRVLLPGRDGVLAALPGEQVPDGQPEIPAQPEWSERGVRHRGRAFAEVG